MDHLTGLNNQLIWITMINHGYIDYTKNFLKSMEKINASFKLIIFCIDQQTINELSSWNNCICLSASSFINLSVSSVMKVWADVEYKKLVFSKLDCIKYALQQTYKMDIKSVGYIDTDIVLLKDPTPIILDIMNENSHIDIFSQCDEKNITCTDIYRCPYICSGCIVFRNKPEQYSIFNYNITDIPQFMGDQDYLLTKIHAEKILYKTVDKNVLLNGSFPNLQSYKIRLPQSACLVHFNYCMGKKKKKLMQLHGMWYL